MKTYSQKGKVKVWTKTDAELQEDYLTNIIRGYLSAYKKHGGDPNEKKKRPKLIEEVVARPNRISDEHRWGGQGYEKNVRRLIYQMILMYIEFNQKVVHNQNP